MVLWPGLGRREVSLHSEATACSNLNWAARLALFLFSGELPICKLCDLLACCWIRADDLRISHYYAKIPLTYHACNSRPKLPYFTIVCWRHGHWWNYFRAACSPVRDYRGFHYRGSRNYFLPYHPATVVDWILPAQSRLRTQSENHGTNNRRLHRLSRPTWRLTRRSR